MSRPKAEFCRHRVSTVPEYAWQGLPQGFIQDLRHALP